VLKKKLRGHRGRKPRHTGESNKTAWIRGQEVVGGKVRVRAKGIQGGGGIEKGGFRKEKPDA